MLRAIPIVFVLAQWTPAQPLFEDRTGASGIAFVLRNAATPEKHQIETMAGGVAVIDYDSDGKPDIFFTNGAKQPSLRKEDPSFCNRLYRNKGNWLFEDVTDKAGVCGEGYSIGAAAGDYNNDGNADLFVAGVNRNILYRNRGDGRFEEVRFANDGRWAVAAGWFDYDNDGWLDLFIVNYVKWDPKKEPFCGDAKGAYRSYCHPKHYEGLANILYHNNRDGTFTDVSQASGIARHTGKGMGVAFADYDDDGRMDVFVANDTAPNFLFRNDGGGRFQENGFLAGVAMNHDGRALSSMGVDWRDLDNEGLPDLFITALSNETFPYYQNQGKGIFSDLTYQSKIGAATMPLSGWGTGIYDFDNDGRKDIFAACGDVQDNTELYTSRKSRQPNLLLLNRGKLFEPRALEPASMYRGAGFADFDGDGRMDVVLTRLNEQAVLLRNVISRDAHWIALKLEGANSNRDGIGARVRIVTASGEQWNHVTTSVGYASSSQREIHFGLGNDSAVKRIEIRWPSGSLQNVDGAAADRMHVIREQP